MVKIRHEEGERARSRDRMFIIDELVRKGGYPSAVELSEYCKVDVRTILRDIQYLKGFLKAPLAYDKSKKGWYYEDKAFALPTHFVKADDLQALLVLGEIVAQYEGTPIAQRMQATFERLVGIFKPEDAQKFKGLTKRICFAPPVTRPMDAAIWETILQALLNDQRLELDYQKLGVGQPVTRRFDAYGLVVRDRDWNLHGYCYLRQCRRTLALPYIRKAELVDEYFDLPNDFDLKRYVKSGFQGSQSDGHPERNVVLRFAPEAAGAAKTRPLSVEQKELTEPTGHLRVSFHTTALFRVEYEVLAWGDKVEVQAPKELRERIALVARNMGKIYR